MLRLLHASISNAQYLSETFLACSGSYRSKNIPCALKNFGKIRSVKLSSSLFYHIIPLINFQLKPNIFNVFLVMNIKKVVILYSHYFSIKGEGLQILTYSPYSWQLSTKESLRCKTYCDTGQRFIMVVSEGPSNSHLLPCVWHWRCHSLF